MTTEATEATAKLDEMALRRPEFRPDVPVVLDDGQTWWLRKPRVVFRPAILPDGTDSLRRSVSAGGEYAARLDALDALISATQADPDNFDGAKFTLAKLRLAIALLQLNYDLAPEQAAELVSFCPGEEATEDNPSSLDVMVEVAQGRGPKPTPGGGGGA